MISFRFLDIPVEIRPSFWIFLLFISGILADPGLPSFIWGGVLVVSVLVHEYGHALTARYFGARPTITLESLGGLASYNSRNLSPWQHFLIVVNGPLFESILIFIPYYLLETGIFNHAPWIRYTLHVSVQLNTYMCLLNLIPIVPLDGSSLLRFFMNRFFRENGQKITLWIGLGVALIAIPYLFWTGQAYFGGLLAFFTVKNFQTLQSLRAFPPNPFALYTSALQAEKDDDLEAAELSLKKLLKSKDKHYKNLATERLAAIYYKENQLQKAYSLLLQGEHQNFKEGKCLLCKLAFANKNYTLVATYSRDIYAIEPTREIALLNAKAFAHLGDLPLSSGWSHTVSQFHQ